MRSVELGIEHGMEEHTAVDTDHRCKIRGSRTEPAMGRAQVSRIHRGPHSLGERPCEDSEISRRWVSVNQSEVDGGRTFAISFGGWMGNSFGVFAYRVFLEGKVPSANSMMVASAGCCSPFVKIIYISYTKRETEAHGVPSASND